MHHVCAGSPEFDKCCALIGFAGALRLLYIVVLNAAVSLAGVL